MDRVLSSELFRHAGRTVELRGWFNNLRPFGKINFLILRDRGGLAQIVFEDPSEYEKIASLQPGSVLRIVGTVKESSQAGAGIEVINPRVEAEVPVLTPPPLEYYKPEIPSDLEHILDHRAVALRNRKIQAVFKIQAEIVHAYRLFMHDEIGAVEYFAPNIIGASSEGGAEFFNVDYFGHTATLAQSSQLYKQIMVGVNERVFALMPFFRAEHSHTTRHLTEGKQFEFETGFFTSWHEIMDIQEACIKYILRRLHKHCAGEIHTLGGSIIQAPDDAPFPRVTFAEAQEIYFRRTGIDERAEPDLSPAAEKELCKYARETSGTDLIFITDWLTSKRPFYSYPDDKNPSLTQTFDLLCAGTEITSGGRRRHTYESMVEGILSKGMDPANFQDYLSIFKYGMPPHGGFGMGLERLTMTILGLKNIREASLFPSDPKRIAGNRIKANVFFGTENIRNEIIRLFKKQGIPFDLLTAESEASSGVQPVKALILKGKTTKKNYQFNIPVSAKLDMKAVADRVGEKCEFESPEVIKERFGLLVGGVPPFGHLLNIDVFFDEKVFSSEFCVFNNGLSTESLKVSSKDLLSLLRPEVGSFVRE